MTKRNKPKKKTEPGVVRPETTTSQIPDATREAHRDKVVDGAKDMEQAQKTRPLEIRLDMMRSIITEPLLSQVTTAKKNGEGGKKFDVILSLNEFYWRGIAQALKEVQRVADDWGVNYATVSHYCFACLTADQILEIADITLKQQLERRNGNTVYRIWEDSDINVTLTKSLTTVKADAAQRAFQAHGEGIVWAVLDSGIQGDHRHFHRDKSPFGPIDTLNIQEPLAHIDFTPDGRGTATVNPVKTQSESADMGKLPDTSATALLDRLGHGTHVAGIIAGYWESTNPAGDPVAGTEVRNPLDEKASISQRDTVRVISGVAPECKLVSMKVIADKDNTGENKQKKGQGKVSWVLLALDVIQKWNQHGKRLLIFGVNMSLGYDFDPRWFACGQSPICVEVNRLVKSGVSVVVSAGNSGYSSFINQAGKAEARFSDLSISDPGNAELAVTVGSTHKEMPHTYGVSYFSSRGPTGDGRIKPDLLAPGERIISCAAGEEVQKYPAKFKDAEGNEQTEPVLYCEQSGTSMAAPHVSGSIAAFLSVRPEFKGQPERVKEILMANTIDLRRERSFQGAGLLDLMKVLQAV